MSVVVASLSARHNIMVRRFSRRPGSLSAAWTREVRICAPAGGGMELVTRGGAPREGHGPLAPSVRVGGRHANGGQYSSGGVFCPN